MAGWLARFVPACVMLQPNRVRMMYFSFAEVHCALLLGHMATLGPLASAVRTNAVIAQAGKPYAFSCFLSMQCCLCQQNLLQCQ
jgi:hypothetical protein